MLHILNHIDFKICVLLRNVEKDLANNTFYQHILARKYTLLDLAAKLIEELSTCIQSLCDEGIRHFMCKARVVCDEISIERMLLLKESGRLKTGC